MSRLTRFRDLLSLLEREYVMLLGEHSEETERMSDWFPPVSAQNEASKERHVLQHPKRNVKDTFSSVVSLDDLGPLGIRHDPEASRSSGASSADAETKFDGGQPIQEWVSELVQELEAEERPEDKEAMEMVAQHTDESVRVLSASEQHVSLTSFETLGTLGTGVSTNVTSNVFPSWWNPDGDLLKQLVAWSSIPDAHTDEAAANEDERTHCIFSPVCFPKLHWDVLGHILILYVAWVMPFQLVFGSEALTPNWMSSLDVAITAFFLVDVLLNFNTGFVVNGHVIFNRCATVRRYCVGWFLFDLVTCFPFGMLDDGGSFTTRGRLLQVLKGLKPVRWIRLVVTVRWLGASENPYFNFVTMWKSSLHSVALLIAFLWNVHLLTCIWSAIQPSTWKAQSFADSLQVYFDAFALVFLAIVTGSRLNPETFGMQILEMLIATERGFIIIGLLRYVAFQCRLLGVASTKSRTDSEHVLRYLQLRGVSVKTEIEVLRVLQDCQGIRTLQSSVAILTDNGMPTKLQQKISVELWYQRLMTMGLMRMISSWKKEFCYSLAVCCQEEIFATGALLFNVADCASAAYCIVDGEFRTASPLIDDDDVPNFTVGMWLGEDALVNPAFRRGLKAFAVRFSSVMAVPSSSFHNILHELNLSEQFDRWVQEGLWRGMCGRCGKLGSHFHDRCYLINRSGLRTTRDSLSSIASTSSDNPVSHAELRKYLKMHDLWDLAPHLKDMGVFSLSDLQELDVEAFRTFLSMKVPPIELTRRHAKLLSRKLVCDFETNMRKGSNIVDEGLHFAFLSHYKNEAGTEAALMLSDLEQMLLQEELHVANQLAAPVFLDSEDLTNLIDLQEHVRVSMNVVLLLTQGVLSRPWCLVELVTASRNDIPVFPILVDKAGATFQFPNEAYYADLVAGKTLNEEAIRFLDGIGIDLVMVEECLREVFNNIALPYSPHRPIQVRTAELRRLLHNCNTTVPLLSLQSSQRPSFIGQRFSNVGQRFSSAGSRLSFGIERPSSRSRSSGRKKESLRASLS